MTWFTETPWPPMIGCAIVAIVLLAAWNSQRRKGYLIGVAVAAVACLAIYFIEKSIITDAERVQTAVYEITSTFQQESKVFSALTPRENIEAESKALAMISTMAQRERSMVLSGLQLAEVDSDMRITDLSVEMKAENSRAISQFRANATISVLGLGASHHPSRWELTWQREGGDWKVIHARRLNILTGEEMSPLEPTQ